MAGINQRYVELEIMTDIVDSLYGSELSMKELTNMVNLEFDENFTEDEIQEFYCVHYHIKKHEEQQQSDVVKWENL
jgi:hypothetical protein